MLYQIELHPRLYHQKYHPRQLISLNEKWGRASIFRPDYYVRSLYDGLLPSPLMFSRHQLKHMHIAEFQNCDLLRNSRQVYLVNLLFLFIYLNNLYSHDGAGISQPAFVSSLDGLFRRAFCLFLSSALHSQPAPYWTK